MSTLTKRECTKPTWHGPHDWWWTSSGGGHMLAGEPTLTDYKVERDLVQYHCEGKDGEGTERGEPESEQMFTAFDQGVKIGRKQMIEEVHQRLVDAGYYTVGFHQALSDLLEEGEIRA